MNINTLKNRRILVVEDEYLLADDLCNALRTAGAEVIGPIPTLAQTMELVAGDTPIDAAVLDVNLRGEMIFPVADALALAGVPFVFATGYDQWSLPDRFAGAAWLEKPLKVDSIAAVIEPLFHRA